MSQLPSQDVLKAQVAQAALAYVQPHSWIGVGTGSTVNFFIDALAQSAIPIKGAVSSSMASTQRMQAHGIQVVDLSEVQSLSVYIDGADEIDGHGYMVKGECCADPRKNRRSPSQAICVYRRPKQTGGCFGHFPFAGGSHTHGSAADHPFICGIGWSSGFTYARSAAVGDR